MLEKEYEIIARSIFGGLLIIAISASPAYAPPCTQNPDFVCGKGCSFYGYCTLPADPIIMCIDIAGGCGSMENYDCCPNR